MTHDLKLVSGNFLFEKLPTHKEYLYKYFKKEPQKLFLAYYHAFSSLRSANPGRFHQNFIDHTGEYWNQQIQCKWMNDAIAIENALEKAHNAVDLELIEIIKTGRYSRKRKCKFNE